MNLQMLNHLLNWRHIIINKRTIVQHSVSEISFMILWCVTTAVVWLQRIDCCSTHWCQQCWDWCWWKLYCQWWRRTSSSEMQSTRTLLCPTRTSRPEQPPVLRGHWLAWPPGTWPAWSSPSRETSCYELCWALLRNCDRDQLSSDWARRDYNVIWSTLTVDCWLVLVITPLFNSSVSNWMTFWESGHLLGLLTINNSHILTSNVYLSVGWKVLDGTHNTDCLSNIKTFHVRATPRLASHNHPALYLTHRGFSYDQVQIPCRHKSWKIFSEISC